MSRLMDEKWPWIEGTHASRLQLFDLLSDTDLAFSPGGQAMTLGALYREMGEVEHAYVQSLQTFKQDWSYRNTDAHLDSSVVQLKAWFQKLDEELKATVAALSDEDAKRTIDRSGYATPVELQLDVYLQALLIFIGKVTIYFKTMNKALPQSVLDYIG